MVIYSAIITDQTRTRGTELKSDPSTWLSIRTKLIKQCVIPSIMSSTTTSSLALRRQYTVYYKADQTNENHVQMMQKTSTPFSCLYIPDDEKTRLLFLFSNYVHNINRLRNICFSVRWSVQENNTVPHII